MDPIFEVANQMAMEGMLSGYKKIIKRKIAGRNTLQTVYKTFLKDLTSHGANVINASVQWNADELIFRYTSSDGKLHGCSMPIWKIVDCYDDAGNLDETAFKKYCERFLR